MDRHPVLAAADQLADLLKGVTDVPVELMSTGEKREALRCVSRVAAQVEGLRLRLVAAADDVATTRAAVTSPPG